MATQWTAGTTSGQVLTAATLNTIGAASVSYTPTLTQGVTVSKTIISAKYWQFQKLIVGTVNFAITSSGTNGVAVQIGLPITANASTQLIIGSYLVIGGPSHYGNKVGSALIYTSTTIGGFVDGGVSNWFGVNPAYQLLNGDGLHATFAYEVA
jgi:hypothetical protein